MNPVILSVIHHREIGLGSKTIRTDMYDVTFLSGPEFIGRLNTEVRNQARQRGAQEGLFCNVMSNEWRVAAL
jgi:hypothetical protein